MMKENWVYCRGDIYCANLDPVVGSEQGGIRPVIVIQNDTGNKHAPTLIVATVTTRIHKKANMPTHFVIYDNPAFKEASVVQLEQIRTIDKSRIDNYLGKEENTNGESKKGASTDGYATAPAKAAPEKKGTYGRYRNVKLTDTDLSKLKAEFPADWQERIDRLSTYMDSSGKSYKNHLATIRNWARRDAKREATSHKPLASNPGRREMTPEEVMEKHGCDYFTAQEMLCDGTY